MANGIVKFDDYLTKLASAFTDEERELFVNSFALHMKYRKDPLAFVIDVEDVVTWLGFSQKVKAVRLLKEHFERDVDFSELAFPVGKASSHGGHNKECIMMSVKTFKKMCMIAKTNKADQVRNYHIKMEEVLFDHIEACNGELQQQLVASKLQGDFDKSQGIVNGNGDVSLCYLIQAVLPAGCDALSQLVGDETLNKFGQTDRLKDRLPELDAEFGVKWKVMAVFRCTKRVKLEAHFRDSDKYAPYKFKGLINLKKSTETFKFTARMLASFKLDAQKEYTKGVYQGATLAEQRLHVQEREIELQMAKLELLKSGVPADDIERTMASTSSTTLVLPEEPAAPPRSTFQPEDTNGDIVYYYRPDNLVHHAGFFNGIVETMRKMPGTSHSQIKQASEGCFVYREHRWQLVPRGTGRIPPLAPTVKHQKYCTGCVASLTDDGSVVEVLDSQKAWADRLGVSPGAISMGISKGRESYTGNVRLAFWDALDKDLQDEYLKSHPLPQKRVNTRSKPVVCIDVRTNCVVGDPYESLEALKTAVGVTAKIVKKCVMDPTYSHLGKRYVFK